jgi:DNA-binding response OmpR family regulator
MELGANEFLAKPFDVDELLKRVHGSLNHKKRSMAGARSREVS